LKDQFLVGVGAKCCLEKNSHLLQPLISQGGGL